MYVKIFSSIFNGSLRGQSDELLVMLNLLCHADVTGVTDIHFQVISDETGLPIDRVKKAIQSLESPDPDSRSPDEEGRRITRIDDHRDWGWHIVNYEKYRKIRSAEEEREKVKQRVQRHREKRRCNADVTLCNANVTLCNADVTDVTQCNDKQKHKEEEEAEAEEDIEEELKQSLCASPAKKKLDLDALALLWNEVCKDLPQVKESSKKRRLKESIRRTERSLEEWKLVFDKIEASDFCKGNGNGTTSWRATYDWIIRSSDNAIKVLEGKYDNKKTKETNEWKVTY